MKQREYLIWSNSPVLFQILELICQSEVSSCTENFRKKKEKTKMNIHRIVPRLIIDQPKPEEETTTKVSFSTDGDREHTYYSSTDYDKFSLIYFNRPVQDVKVQKIASEIRAGKNYLSNYPANVTSEGIITDGQHRHAAARQEQVPFFYIVSNVFEMDDAIAANTVTSNWTTYEYMESFSKRGFTEYEKINNFYIENSWIKISQLPKLCSSSGYSKLNFNNGHYTANRMEFAYKIAAMVNSFRPFIGDKQSEYLQFVQTVQNLASNPNYNHKRMIEKMRQRGSLFKRQASVPQYLDMLTQIYNYRVAPENRVLLTEDFIRARWQREGKPEEK